MLVIESPASDSLSDIFVLFNILNAPIGFCGVKRLIAGGILKMRDWMAGLVGLP